MVRKDEPMKVTDLEAGGEEKSSKDPPKRQSVFDRLAYAGTKSSSSKKIADESTSEKTGKLAAKKNIAAKPKLSVTNPDGQPTSSSSSGSVFDRLTSGERLYRTTTTQSGRKPAGRRAEENSKAARKSTPQSSNDVTAIIPETMEETANGSPERELDDVFNEEDDPVIHISLIQPPVKVRSARPAKKSARLQEQTARRRRKSWRLQRIPLALVERTSLARGALPILPQTLAWICLIFNGLLPGTGTVLSGLLGICLGAPRFSALVTAEHRFLGFIINLTVGIFQAVTVLFCLVGWCWSLGWGIILVKTAGYYKSWKKNNLDNGQDELPHVINSIGFNNIKDEPRY